MGEVRGPHLIFPLPSSGINVTYLASLTLVAGFILAPPNPWNCGSAGKRGARSGWGVVQVVSESHPKEHRL